MFPVGNFAFLRLSDERNYYEGLIKVVVMEKNYKIPWVISDFRRKVDKINALLGYHADFMQFLHDALEFELLSMSLNKH